MHFGLRAGRQGKHRHHLLAGGYSGGHRTAHALPGARDHHQRAWSSGVVYYDADGVEQFQPAEVVILACNAVGTARILLNSASARFSTGLANSSGLVGKNLMFHPYARIAGYFDETLDRRGVGFPDHLDRCRDVGFDSDFHDPFLLASSFSHREADAAVTITYFAQKSGANVHGSTNPTDVGTRCQFP
jgi:choline dehydrogenase-like flavoprotein